MRLRTVAVTAAATISAALFAVASGATSQDDVPNPAPGVVLQVHQESTTRNVMLESMANDAQAAGIDGAMIASIFSQLTGALEGGMAETGMSSMLPAGMMSKLKVGGHLAAHEIAGGLEDARTPEFESSDYTVYIRPDLFKVEADGFTMLWKPAGATGGAAMWYGDPATGQLMKVDLGAVDAFVGDRAEHTGMEITPLPGNPTREILGHTAYGYSYRYTMDLAMGGGSGMGAMAEMLPISAENVVEGEAWLAPDVPEAGEISSFFRNFADGFGSQTGMMGGLIGGMADLAATGVPLETSETIRTYLLAQMPNMPERLLMIEGTSSSLVTDISRRVLDDDLLFGADGSVDLADVEGGAPAATPAPGTAGAAGKVCDCSCDAFEELQEMDESDPDAMAMAMCAQKCMSRWIGCAAP